MLSSVELPLGFDVLLGPAEPLDPIGDPERVREVLAESHDAGATVFRLTVVHDSLGHYLEQLAAYAELVDLEAAQ
jgi:hypothetical protein